MADSSTNDQPGGGVAEATASSAIGGIARAYRASTMSMDTHAGSCWADGGVQDDDEVVTSSNNLDSYERTRMYVESHQLHEDLAGRSGMTETTTRGAIGGNARAYRSSTLSMETHAGSWWVDGDIQEHEQVARSSNNPERYERAWRYVESQQRGENYHRDTNNYHQRTDNYHQRSDHYHQRGDHYHQRNENYQQGSQNYRQGSQNYQQRSASHDHTAHYQRQGGLVYSGHPRANRFNSFNSPESHEHERNPSPAGSHDAANNHWRQGNLAYTQARERGRLYNAPNIDRGHQHHPADSHRDQWGLMDPEARESTRPSNTSNNPFRPESHPSNTPINPFRRERYLSNNPNNPFRPESHQRQRTESNENDDRQLHERTQGQGRLENMVCTTVLNDYQSHQSAMNANSFFKTHEPTRSSSNPESQRDTESHSDTRSHGRIESHTHGHNSTNNIVRQESFVSTEDGERARLFRNPNSPNSPDSRRHERTKSSESIEDHELLEYIVRNGSHVHARGH